MTRRTMSRMLLKTVLAVAVAGLLAVPTTHLALADDGPGSQASFVLLSMEQAATYRGTQAPYTCTGTGTYTGCKEPDNICGYDDPATCNSSLGRDYSGSTMTYCTGVAPWAPGSPTCDYVDTKVCYTWFECIWHFNEFGGYCMRQWETHDSTWDNWVCTGGALPPPGGE